MSSTSANNNLTPAQEEFQDLINKNTDNGPHVHPEDLDDARRYSNDSDDDDDDEDRYRQSKIDAAMRVPITGGDVKLPPAAFDSGRSTGVKGVIADARAYEEARQGKWRTRVRAARRSVFGMGDAAKRSGSNSGESDDDFDQDEESFLQQWRETRRQQLEQEAQNGIRNRRTSPSLRMWGRFDSVDALGYLDAIEKVGRETTVAVFVYDHQVSLLSCVTGPKKYLAKSFRNSAKYRVSLKRP